MLGEPQDVYRSSHVREGQQVRPSLQVVILALGICIFGAAATTPSGVSIATQAFSRGDFASAFKWYREAARQGDVEAHTQLGLLYEKGSGVPQDDREAARWYRLTADKGSAIAQNYLGLMYDDGVGVQQDAKEAANWYRLSADQGYSAA